MRISVFDSITHVGSQMRGDVVLAASHGGMFVAHMALDLGVAAVVVCDAGIGRERAGVAGLAVLASHNVPAAAIAALSARIGDGSDCHDNGVISVANAAAEAFGVVSRMPVGEALRRLDDCAPSAIARTHHAPVET